MFNTPLPPPQQHRPEVFPVVKPTFGMKTNAYTSEKVAKAIHLMRLCFDDRQPSTKYILGIVVVIPDIKSTLGSLIFEICSLGSSSGI